MTITATTVHPFEKAGLGLAPFKLVGLVDQQMSHGERVIGSVGGCPMTTKPGGTCDFCGKYILNMFRVESSDGKKFTVGCDCVRKVGQVLGTDKIEPALKKLKKDRLAARISEAKAALPNAHALRNKPHPNAHLASEGRTLANYAEWLFKNGGTAGQLRAARMVELAMTPKAEDE